MFRLVAEAWKHKYSGEVASRTFDDIGAAERLMRNWARFGVEGLCDEADRLCIYDAENRPVRLWSRREKRSVDVTGQMSA